MREKRKKPDDSIECLPCGWEGLLRECTYEKLYTEHSIIHMHNCPECESDLYTFTEDKVPETEVDKDA